MGRLSPGRSHRGTSAGAAVMSHIMYRDARNVLETLTKGVSMGHEIAYRPRLSRRHLVRRATLAGPRPVCPGDGGHAIARS